MRKFDLSLRSSRSSYFATFRHQLTILSKTDALDEEKWLNMLGTFVKDWFRYESHFVHGRDSLVDILKERGLLSESDAVQPLIVLITLLNVTLIILTLSVSRLLNLLLRLVAFLLFLNPQCLASISRWITASSSWKRFCLFVCRALSSIMVICMLTAIRLLLTFVMSLYLLLRS